MRGRVLGEVAEALGVERQREGVPEDRRPKHRVASEREPESSRQLRQQREPRPRPRESHGEEWGEHGVQPVVGTREDRQQCRPDGREERAPAAAAREPESGAADQAVGEQRRHRIHAVQGLGDEEALGKDEEPDPERDQPGILAKRAAQHRQGSERQHPRVGERQERLEQGDDRQMQAAGHPEDLLAVGIPGVTVPREDLLRVAQEHVGVVDRGRLVRPVEHVGQQGSGGRQNSADRSLAPHRSPLASEGRSALGPLRLAERPASPAVSMGQRIDSFLCDFRAYCGEVARGSSDGSVDARDIPLSQLHRRDHHAVTKGGDPPAA